jgi:hypothetical protein
MWILRSESWRICYYYIDIEKGYENTTSTPLVRHAATHANDPMPPYAIAALTASITHCGWLSAGKCPPCSYLWKKVTFAVLSTHSLGT